MKAPGFGLALALAAALALAGCATAGAPRDDVLTGGLFGPALSPAKMEKAITAAAAYPLGSKENPVRVHMPPGERAFERLSAATATRRRWSAAAASAPARRQIPTCTDVAA